jgi:hypothetical protein
MEASLEELRCLELVNARFHQRSKIMGLLYAAVAALGL